MRLTGTHIALGAAALLVVFGVSRAFWGSGGDAQDEVSLSAEELSSRVQRRADRSGSSSLGTGKAAREGGKVRGRPAEGVPSVDQLLPKSNFGSDSPVEFEAPSGMRDPGQATPEEARASFEGALEELDLAIAGDLVLTVEDEQRIYAQVTGSFEVLTAHVSRNNPEQLAFIETAHAEMLHKLREAEVVPARPGAKERPTRDPRRHLGFRYSRSAGG